MRVRHFTQLRTGDIARALAHNGRLTTYALAEALCLERGRSDPEAIDAIRHRLSNHARGKFAHFIERELVERSGRAKHLPSYRYIWRNPV